MGIYTSNRYFGEAYDYASEIPANEAYDAAFGCAHILADCQTNDMALFESSIYSDFAEVKAMQEGYGYVNENAFTNVIKKIVEMFKKLLAKIKGIFKAFIAKLIGAFKNGKDLVKKYEKQIIKYANWKGFKCKGIRVPKSDNVMTAINNLFKYSDSSVGINADIYKLRNETRFNSSLNDAFEKLFGTKDADKIKDMENDEIKEKLLATYTTKAFEDVSDFHENVTDELYDDKDTIDEDEVKSASYFSKSWIKNTLSEGEKWEKDIKKFNERIEKNINIIIDNLNKCDDDLAKFIKDNPNEKINSMDDANDVDFAKSNNGKISKNGNTSFVKHGKSDKGMDTDIVQKAIHALQKVANNEQEVITKVTSEYMTQVKFAIGQARKVWTAAAAWSSGVHKESVEYAQAVGESSAEEFYINMEAVC